MQEILDVIHKTIYQFFDVCGDDEEVPMSDKDKLLLEVNKAICNNLKALEQESCEDSISRQAVLDLCDSKDPDYKVIHFKEDVECLPPVNPQPKIGYCRDCKWWKDSDGAFRRGIEAESQCPMNRIEVYEGNGYCYMFEPQERSEV